MAEADMHAYVRDQFVATLAQIQADASREVSELTDAMVPFRDLPGFDSLNGVEAAVLLSERLGVEVEEIAFLTPGGERALTVGEIVDAIVTRYGAALARRSTSAGPGAPDAAGDADARVVGASAAEQDATGPARPAYTL